MTNLRYVCHLIGIKKKKVFFLALEISITLNTDNDKRLSSFKRNTTLGFE